MASGKDLAKFLDCNVFLINDYYGLTLSEYITQHFIIERKQVFYMQIWTGLLQQTCYRFSKCTLNSLIRQNLSKEDKCMKTKL